MRKKILPVLLILLSTACVKQVDWPIHNQTGDLIVVDGILTNEEKTQTITLSRPVTNLGETPLMISNANIVVSNEDSTWNLAEDTLNPGKYNTPSTFTAIPGKNYSLLIYNQGKVYSAKAAMAPGSVFPILHYSKDESDDLYHIDFVASAFTAGEPAMWEILIDWSKVPGYDTLDPSRNHARLLFYTLKTLDVSEVFAPVVENVTFPTTAIEGQQAVIEQRRYSLTPEHAEFIRTMLLETEWQGSLFGSASANIATNLSSGATGFFGVCAVNTVSITVIP
jgi:hypothetical protein